MRRKNLPLCRMATLVPAQVPIGNDNTLDPKLIHACAPRHWDPTMIFRRTVPQQYPIPLPTDPRPWAKICLQYHNTGPATPAPEPPKEMLFPGASEFFPPSRYQAAIDNESLLRRLDRPLNNDLLPAGYGETSGCYPNQYTVPPTSDVWQQRTLLPPQTLPRSKMVRELEAPAVLHRPLQYDCSKAAMMCDIAKTPKFWNNHSKLAKYEQRDQECGNMLWQYQDGTYPSSVNLPRPVPQQESNELLR